MSENTVWQKISTVPANELVWFLAEGSPHIGVYDPNPECEFPYEFVDRDTDGGWNAFSKKYPPSHWAPMIAPAHPDTLTDEAKACRSKALDELGALDGELI